MMNRNKRRIIDSDMSDEDDSFKYRRSSLKVNLSYTANLTDSGNGSLWKTEIENNDKIREMQIRRRLSRSRTTYEKTNYQSKSSNENLPIKNDINKHTISNDSTMNICNKKGIQLKNLTINLEDISAKEHILDANCKHLKNMIINKTKEMFNKSNELAIKTAIVLADESNHFTDGHDSDSNKKSVLALNTSNDHSGNEITVECEHKSDNVNHQHENPYYNIVATPTSNNKQRNSERSVDKSKLTPKQLFINEGKQNCRIIEDIILSKNIPLPILRQTNQMSSPILSGSNRRFSRLQKKRSKLDSQSQCGDHNNTYSITHSDCNTDIDLPILSSTFIENNAMDKEQERTPYMKDDTNISRATYTTNNIVSMEMTKVHGGIRMSKKYISPENSNMDASNYARNNKKKESEDQSLKQTTKETPLVTKTRDIHEVSNRIDNGNEKCTISLNDSTKTTRSSLNVNTSLDMPIETSQVKNLHKSNDSKITSNLEMATTSNTNSIRTSLQMNTSIDSICKTSRRKNHSSKQSLTLDQNDENVIKNQVDNQISTTKDNETDNIESLENISLIERLRNISKIRNKENVENIELNTINTKQNSKCCSRNSYSYVEATPYPISRSVLFKSQLRCKTWNLDNNTLSCINSLKENNKENTNKTTSHAMHSKTDSNDICVSNETAKTETDTVILQYTPSCDLFISQEKSVVVENTLDAARLKMDEKDTIISQNTKYDPVRKSKRKLLPLYENSQLCSISPLEESSGKYEKPTSIKRNKKLKKKCPKSSSKHNTNNVKCDLTSEEESYSNSNGNAFKNKKRKNKKQKKPRNVVSKKIVIKKFVDKSILDDMLNMNKQNKINETVESRDSLDDFVAHRIVPTQWNKHRSQKIIIVTTGLSTEDKNLVKKIVKALGMAEMEINVSKRTTHVVTTGVRTTNLLRGIIRGCWLISLEWVLKSLENNKWLNPEEYEMKHFSKAVLENRKDRLLFGSSYIPELFTTCGFIYIEHKTVIPHDTLKELIKTAGGHITENPKLAKIVIGTNGLKETWVIDSITTGKLQLTKCYQRK